MLGTFTVTVSDHTRLRWLVVCWLAFSADQAFASAGSFSWSLVPPGPFGSFVTLSASAAGHSLERRALALDPHPPAKAAP